MDERLHRRVQLVPRREDDLAVVGDPRLAFHLVEPVEALADDAHGLAHLVHVHLVTVVDVAVRVDGDVELDLVVGEIGHRLTEVPVHARGPEHRPGLRERERVVRREQADPLRPLEPDRVAVEDRFVLVHRLGHRVAELARLVREPGRDVLREPTHLEVAGVHARAADHLEQVEDLVAVVEAVPEERDRPELERRGTEPDQMGVDSVELGQRHARPGRLARCLELEELLDGQHVEELVRLEGDVVDPRRVRDRLPPRLRLHVLLEPRVEVADDRADARDRLPVEVDDQPEHAVGRGVVGPEVDGQDVVERVQLGVDLEDGRHRLRDARPLVDPLRGDDGHRYSASENRTGSPPSG